MELSLTAWPANDGEERAIVEAAIVCVCVGGIEKWKLLGYLRSLWLHGIYRSENNKFLYQNEIKFFLSAIFRDLYLFSYW